MSSESVGNGRLGAGSLAAGAAAVVGVLMIGQASFGWIPGLDPPGWLRIVTGWMLPVGALAALVLGALSFRGRAGRPLGIAGVLLGVGAVGGFVAMLAANPY